MKLVEKTPILTTILLEGANVGQLIRMWTDRTAEGQEVTSWIMVNLALILWVNFYIKTMPKGTPRNMAVYATLFGIFMNFLVILTVLYFRYV